MTHIAAAPSGTGLDPLRSFSSTPSAQAATAKRRAKQRDPYIIAQAAARKAANTSRQEVLRKQRTAAAGDPVKGITTPFVQSFDATKAAASPSAAATTAAASGEKSATTGSDNLGLRVEPDEHLNNFLDIEEVNRRLKDSYISSAPLPEERQDWFERHRRSLNQQQAQFDPESVKKWESEEQQRLENANMERSTLHRERHDNAVAALTKIVSLSNGSAADRGRVNTQRCIETFGRHNTDQTLEPRPLGLPRMPRYTESPQAWVEQALAKAKEQREQSTKQRGGPDTGSSEVQIAILTAKIRAMSQHLDARGSTDKVGKRDLRLLVHKRQKLLKYLWRKDKGGPRWQHCVDTLGLTDATWKGEITL